MAAEGPGLRVGIMNHLGNGSTVHKSNENGPVIAPKIRHRILEKVSNNRITIIVGPTGCGKSTQVPTILLDGLQTIDRDNRPILCTQPRRLAVVAIANHVKKQRRVQDPQKDEYEVGYHVGQKNKSSPRTKLLFATAGILLEEIKCNGTDAVFSKYKCILIDECHERSAESDLCLTMLKSYLAHKRHKATIKVVLMSATFHHNRYRSFFQSVPGCEQIDTVTLETVESIKARQIETFYLEDVVKHFVKYPKDHKALERTMRLDPKTDLMGGDKDDGGKSLSNDLVNLIESLVINLDTNEPPEASFLIFAPTYRHLEQIYEVLQLVNLNGIAVNEFFLSVLHSSVDMEDCLQAMKPEQDPFQLRPRRHIFLASAIADSSLTIPGVTCVIDTCRALEVKWDRKSHNHVAKTVWASKSICDQRQGRTGRTCPGRVFRLLPKSYYIGSLEQWEQAQLLLSSCQNEVLCLLSATAAQSSGMQNALSPAGLLERCMDPPPAAVVNQAIHILKDIGACVEVRQNRSTTKLVPTEYGRLLSSMPFALEDSRKIIAGAQYGYLHEALALWTITSMRPYPIVHVFGDTDANEDAMRVYYPNCDARDPKSIAIANLAAYIFWDTAWNHQRNKRMRARFLRRSSPEYRKQFPIGEEKDDNEEDRETLFAPDCNVWKWDAETDRMHMEFCKMANINPTSVRAVAETIEVTMKTFFSSHHEPEWLRCTNPEPLWRRPKDWNENGNGSCSSHSMCVGDFDSSMLHLVYDNRETEIITALGYVWDGIPLPEPPSGTSTSSNDIGDILTTIAESQNRIQYACIPFLTGHCHYGERCHNAHSFTAERPPCRFFATGRCTKGDECLYSHKPKKAPHAVQSSNNSDAAATTHEAPETPVTKTSNSLKAVAPLKFIAEEGFAMTWYKKNAKRMFMLGDGDFSFSKGLSKSGYTPLFSTTLEGSGRLMNFINGVDATRLHCNKDFVKLLLEGNRNGGHRTQDSNFVQYCAWNYPYVTGAEMDAEAHEKLLAGTFLSLRIFFKQLLLNKCDQLPQFGIALQGDQFSRWSVLRSANQAGWNLVTWGPADDLGYAPLRANGQAFPVDQPRFYIFSLPLAKRI